MTFLCANGCDVYCDSYEFVCSWCHHHNRKLKERRNKFNMSTIELWLSLLMTSPYHEIPKIFLVKVDVIQKLKLSRVICVKTSTAYPFSKYLEEFDTIEKKLSVATNKLKNLYGPKIIYQAIKATDIFPACISDLIAEYAVCY